MKTRTSFLFASLSLTLLLGCPKKDEAPVVDASPPPPPPVEDAGSLQLEPLVEDAGVDASDAAVKKLSGPGLSLNQARLKQCCSALRTYGKSLGASPEANMITGVAAQCDQVAMQAGATKGGQVPELAFLRMIPKLPPLCQGL